MSEINNLDFNCPQCSNPIHICCNEDKTSKVTCPGCSTDIVAGNSRRSYRLEVFRNTPKRKIRKMRAYL